MKNKLLVILLFLCAFAKAFSHKEWVHEFIVKESYKLLYNEIGTVNNLELNIAPNPSSNFLIFKFRLYEKQQVSMFVINSLGGRVSELLQNANLNPDVHSIKLETSQLPPGVYFCVLQTNTETITRQFAVVR
ncbi:MAG: type sorting protein [Bacteroidota bacterium]|nr:type sorting protein [Bacteroidota bacterium]